MQRKCIYRHCISICVCLKISQKIVQNGCGFSYYKADSWYIYQTKNSKTDIQQNTSKNFIKKLNNKNPPLFRKVSLKQIKLDGQKCFEQLQIVFKFQQY